MKLVTHGVKTSQAWMKSSQIGPTSFFVSICYTIKLKTDLHVRKTLGFLHKIWVIQKAIPCSRETLEKARSGTMFRPGHQDHFLKFHVSILVEKNGHTIILVWSSFGMANFRTELHRKGTKRMLCTAAAPPDAHFSLQAQAAVIFLAPRPTYNHQLAYIEYMVAAMTFTSWRWCLQYQATSTCLLSGRSRRQA